jgi:23S rRNA (adenine1618-N6)-methyltransferase
MNLLIFASMAMNSMGMDRKPPLKTAPKEGFHLRNKHRNRYDFQFLKSTNPELVSYVAVNKYGDESIEFSNPLAVTALNKVLQ